MRFRVERIPQDLNAEVRARYGAAATVRRVDEVLSGGVRGFFARRSFEVTVDLPEPAPHAVPHAASVGRPTGGNAARPAAAGLEALLDRAEEAEARAFVAAAPLSTESAAFDDVLADLGGQIGRRPVHPSERDAADTPPVPLLPVEPGSLVVVAGLVGDALGAARSLAALQPHLTVFAGGQLDADLPRIDDRRSALAARSRCVGERTVAVAAFGLGSGLVLEPSAALVAAVGADQVWLAVDPSRKSEDTARWVRAVASRTPVEGILAHGDVHTSTPDSLAALGLPVSRPAPVR